MHFMKFPTFLVQVAEKPPPPPTPTNQPNREFYFNEKWIYAFHEISCNFGSGGRKGGATCIRPPTPRWVSGGDEVVLHPPTPLK